MEFCGFDISNLKLEAEKLLDNCIEASEEFEYFLTHPSIKNFLDIPRFALGEYTNLDYGQTRGVLLPKERDLSHFVIKIPFLIEETTDDATGDPMSFDAVDYCRCEVRNYLLAKRKYLHSLLAPCTKILDYQTSQGTIPIYLMKRAKVDEDEAFNRGLSIFRESFCSDYPQSPDQTDDEYEDEIYSSFSEEDETECLTSMIAAEFGGEVALEFADFCEENYINDIHRANIGFDEDGQIIVIDYGGFSLVEDEARTEEWWDIGEEV